MERRIFLNQLCSFIGSAAVIEMIESCSQPNVNPKPAANFSIDLTNPTYAPLKTVGGVVQTSSGVFLVRASASSYLALSPICTHAGCSVGFSSQTSQFVCPCHGGVFNLQGNVVSGPPPSPLAQYTVTVNGNTLSVS